MHRRGEMPRIVILLAFGLAFLLQCGSPFKMRADESSFLSSVSIMDRWVYFLVLLVRLCVRKRAIERASESECDGVHHSTVVRFDYTAFLAFTSCKY